MNIYFDVDDTIVTWDHRLRPHVHDVFRRLRDEGHRLYLWSGRGKRWEVAGRHGLGELIVTCHEKPLQDHHAQLGPLGVDPVPDFVVDDYYAVVRAFGGYWIAPPRHPFEQDRQMWRVYDSVQRFIAGSDPPEAGRPFIARWDQP